MKWRMIEPCANCPFNPNGEGLRLRKSLRPGRWYEILKGLQRGGHFDCHKTTSGEEDENGDTIRKGSELLCAGAIAWQQKRGISSQLCRIMNRLNREIIEP